MRRAPDSFEMAEEPVHYDFMRGTRSTALTMMMMMIVCGPTTTATTPSNLSELLTSLLRRQAQRPTMTMTLSRLMFNG